MPTSFKYSLFVLLLLGVCYLPAQQVLTDFLVPQANRGASLGIDFSEQLTNYEVYELSRQDLKRLSQKGAERIVLSWNYQGEVLELALERVSLFKHDFRVRIGSHAQAREVAADYGVHYRGSIVGRSRSLVALSLFDDNLIGLINDDELGLINLGVLPKHASPDFLRLIAYPESAHLNPPGFDCHTPDDTPEETNLPPVNSAILNSFCFSSYLECDFAFYQEQGSNVNNVISYITGAFNSVAMIYDNEDIEATISEIFVWTEPDGYNTNDAEDAINDFVVAMSGGFNGDLAHLVSRNPNNIGGYAWINVVCSSNSGLKTAYSNIDPGYNDFPQYSWTVNVLTHEIGHNLGSRHTHACVWNGDNTQIDDCGNAWAESNGNTPEGDDCYDSANPAFPANGGTIMSYCHLQSGVGVNFNEGFGVQPGDRIRSVISNCSNCISTDPPVNNNCSDATLLSCGETATGSTEFATNEDQPGSCNNVNLSSAPGVWYRYVGDGAIVSAALCNSSFDTQLGVFTGSCGQLNCLQSDENSCGDGTNATLAFTTIPGQDYYLYVTGTLGAGGDYSLLITCEFPTPDNDLCAGAIAIECGETLTGSTEFATNEDAPADCGTELGEGPGLWYVFEGTGEEVTLTTCSEDTNFDTKIGVFQGDCGVLACVAGDDDDPGCTFDDLNTTVTFNTTQGEDYFIYVTGFGSNNGDFTLAATCVAACFPPTDLAVNEQGYAFASLSWSAASAADTYQIRYRQQGTSNWETLPFTAELEQIIGSLQACTTYEIQVRSDCEGTLTDYSDSVFFNTDGCDDDYCFAYGDSFNEWITEVSLANLSNVSGNGFGYTNFTNQTANVEEGQNYNLSLVAESNSVGPVEVFWSAWIDFNQDAVFSVDEQIATNIAAMSNEQVNTMISIPLAAMAGTTRLRVMMSVSDSSNPCASEGSRDVEDYAVTIGATNTELSVDPEMVFFAASGGTEEINVSSNVDWTVSETALWLSVSPENGFGNGSFTITCNPNMDNQSRTATITISGGGITLTVTVEQEGNENILTVNPENIFFAAPGGNQNITISSNVNWTVEENAAWFSVDPESGQGDGIINISCQLNPNLSSRTATITIIGGGIERTITVEQSGAMPFLTATPENVFFTAPGGMEEVMVNSNVSWTVSENSPWFSIDPQSGIDNGSFIIECDANTGTQSRSATITLSGGGITLIITVEQAGTAPMLTVTPSSVFFQEAGGSATIVVSSNVSWTVDENTLWLSVNPLNGAGNGSFTISCQPHTGTQSRTAIITVMGGGVSRTVTVEQAGMTPFLSANPEDLFFPAAGDSEEIIVNSNISWIVSGGDSWLSFSTQNGTGSSSFTVTCEPNPGTEIRTAVITISGNGLTRSIEVGQAGSVPFLDVSQDFVFFNPPGGSEQIELSSNIAWTITSSEPWVSVSPMSGNGDASLFLDCDENTDPDTREAVFTIIGDGINASFTVEQFGTNIFCVDSETNIDTMLCAGQTVVIGENSYTESGTFENLFQTEDGCDSLIILNLEVLTLTGILPTELTTCQGMPANLFAPAGYLISLPGENAVNSLELMPGTYTITLEEQMLGCQSEQMITVLNEGGLSVNISGETSVCNDETSLITASGGLTYEWSGGATPNSAANELSIGDYSLTVTDASGCSVVESISITADQTAPVFTDCPQSQSFQLAAGQNMMPVNWLEPSATDNCGIDGLSISSTHQSGDMFMEGTTTVNYTASDQVGQTSNCSFNITILGATVNDELTFYLDTVGYTRSGDTLCVPVRVLNFVDVAAFQLSLLADDEILSSLDTALAVSPLTGLDGVGGVLFDRVNSQQAQLIWLNGTGQGLTLADGSAILTVKMLVDNPPPGSCIPLAITDDPLFVEAFVVGEGSIVPQIINGSICLAGEYAISGEIYRIDDEPINLAEVSLLGNDTTEVDTTDVAGRYGFADVLGGSEYILRPARDFGDAEGLSVLDMITILRHVQGQTLIDDPYLLLAADVNQSQSISTGDILEIRELVLGNLTAFGNHTSWFFLPVDYSFPNPANPWQEAVPHEVIFPSLDADTVVDFYGLKTGDVNLSNIGQNLINNNLVLSYVDQEYSPGQLLEVAVYVSDFTDLSGFQLALSSGELEILDMVPGAATVVAGSLVSRPESWQAGELPLIFLRQQTTDNAADSPLFTLQLRAKTTGRLSEQLRMNNSWLAPEAFTNDLSPLNIELSASTLTNTASALGNTTALLRVQPNPFRQQFQLDFYLSQATDVHLQLMDVQGRVVYEQSTAAAAGAVSLTLAPKNALSAGVYFCRWQTEQASGVVRVVKE